MCCGRSTPALVVTAGSVMSVGAWLTCCKALGASADVVSVLPKSEERLTGAVLGAEAER